MIGINDPYSRLNVINTVYDYHIFDMLTYDWLYEYLNIVLTEYANRAYEEGVNDAT